METFIKSLYLFVILDHSFATILRSACITYGNFSIVKSGVVLPGSLLATHTSIAVSVCEALCIQHPSCKSINTRDTDQTCELNNKSTDDFSDGLNHLTAKTGWTYRSTYSKDPWIGPYCARFKPCNGGYQCIDSCDCPGYQCVPKRFKDCETALTEGYKTDGVYHISSRFTPWLYYPVRCDMTTVGGPWLVFQRRIDNTVDFFRGWADYKKGFGDLNGNFWLGLDIIHMLADASFKVARLRIDIKHLSLGYRYAMYSHFTVGREADSYRLSVSGYSGNAGDSMPTHNNRVFVTKDRNDVNFCAKNYKGGWWYSGCHNANLNGLYDPNVEDDASYISWRTLQDTWGRLAFTEMKLKYP